MEIKKIRYLRVHCLKFPLVSWELSKYRSCLCVFLTIEPCWFYGLSLSLIGILYYKVIVVDQRECNYIELSCLVNYLVFVIFLKQIDIFSQQHYSQQSLIPKRQMRIWTFWNTKPPSLSRRLTDTLLCGNVQRRSSAIH